MAESNNTDWVQELSQHLFWDTNCSNVDPEKNARWLIQRVLEYGLLNDWRLIYKYYGLERITEEALQMRSLDNISMSFISMLSGIKKEEFRCYKFRQSNPHYWIY